MFIAWQYPTSSFVQLYAVRTLLNRSIPSSLWNPGYSGRLRFRSFSISSIARDSRPSNFARVSANSVGFSSRKNKDPDVNSHISPRSRFGKPTRISLWKVGCRIRVTLRPFSRRYSPQSLILLLSRSFRASPGYRNSIPSPASGGSPDFFPSPCKRYSE